MSKVFDFIKINCLLGDLLNFRNRFSKGTFFKKSLQNLNFWNLSFIFFFGVPLLLFGLIHLVPVLLSYRNQSIDLLTGFYMRATLALNGLRIYVSWNYISLFNSESFESLQFFVVVMTQLNYVMRSLTKEYWKNNSVTS